MASHHHPYYDPFSPREEEEYLEMERKESQEQIHKWIQALLLSFTCQPPTIGTATSKSTPSLIGNQDSDQNNSRKKLVIPTWPTPWINENNINNYNNNGFIMEIQLNLPLELRSLQDLVYAMQQQPSSLSSTTNTNTRLYRLKLSHWGLPPDQGITTIIPLLPQLVELSLPFCGITAQAFYQLLLALQETVHGNGDDHKNSNLQILNLSHNLIFRTEGYTMKMDPKFRAALELYQQLFLHALPPCTLPDHSLKHLNLSSTGLQSPDLLDVLWQGVQQSRLHSLDISNNETSHSSDMTTVCLQTILPYLSTLPLQSLILTQYMTPRTTTTTTSQNLMDQVEQQLQHNHTLMYLGPFSTATIQPPPVWMDPNSHVRTRPPEGNVHDFYLRRNRLRYWYKYLGQPQHPSSSPSTTTTTTTPTGALTTTTTSSPAAAGRNNACDTTSNTGSTVIPSKNLEYGAISVLLETLVTEPTNRYSYSLVYWIFQETNILRERTRRSSLLV